MCPWAQAIAATGLPAKTAGSYILDYLNRHLDEWGYTDIVARSDGPLLTATLPWETCPEGKGWQCQEPMVVFSTGLKPLGGDEFLVIYGGADTDVGIGAAPAGAHAPFISNVASRSTMLTYRLSIPIEAGLFAPGAL